MEVALELPPGSLGEDQLVRLQKQIEQLDRNRAGLEGRLSNSSFTAKAPPEVVDGARQQLAEVTTRLERLRQTIEASAG
jgi:valyl-tRNA synthetase